MIIIMNSAAVSSPSSKIDDIIIEKSKSLVKIYFLPCGSWDIAEAASMIPQPTSSVAESF